MRFSKLVVRVLFVSSFLAAAAGAQATTWYVSTSGNDANTGTIDQPYATITKAASMSRAGDVVNVRGGVYHEIVKISSKGTSSARIVFRSYPGETAVIDGTGSASNTNLVQLNSTEYVDFSGFEVRNSTRIGICAYPSKFTRILSNVIHDSVKSGIYAGYSTMGTSGDITIDGNTVYNNVLENQLQNMTTGWSQAVGICRTDRATVTNNRIYKNYGEGLVFILSDSGTASHNTLYDNFSVELYLDNAQYTTIDSNYITNTGDTKYYRAGYPAHGVGMANETYTDTNPLTDLRITNNIVVNSRWSLYYGNYENGGGLKNTTIANNTFYNGAAALLSIASDTHSNSFVENNVFYQAGSGSMASVAGGGITYRNNNWYGGSAGTAAGSGDIAGNPQLANAGGANAADYKLTSASPVLQHGVDLSTLVASDYFGAPRAAAFDMGAHQYSTSVGQGDIQSPSAPANLSASAGSSSSVNLTWSGSTDNVGVTGYRVYRNSSLVASVGSTGYTDQGLAASTSYSYQVSAVDAAGNESARSNTATATTSAAASTASMHVANVAISYSRRGKYNYYTPQVTVVDAGGNVVSGVAVSGAWSGALSGSGSATTQSNGVATFSSARTTSAGAVTFTVTSLAKSGYTYSASSNTETNASAQGTSAP